MEVVRCTHCGSVVLDGAFTGVARVRCPNKRCRRRVWVGGNEDGFRVIQVDKPPKQAA